MRTLHTTLTLVTLAWAALLLTPAAALSGTVLATDQDRTTAVSSIAVGGEYGAESVYVVAAASPYARQERYYGHRDTDRRGNKHFFGNHQPRRQWDNRWSHHNRGRYFGHRHPNHYYRPYRGYGYYGGGHLGISFCFRSGSVRICLNDSFYRH